MFSVRACCKTTYKLQKAGNVVFPFRFSFFTDLHKDGTAVKQCFIGLIAEIEFSILVLGATLRVARSNSASMFFVLFDRNCNHYGYFCEFPEV